MADVTALLNISAGTAEDKEARDNLETQLKSTFPGILLVKSEKGSDIGELAKRAVQQAGQMVIAAGGDGTLSAVSGVLATTKKRISLGLIPFGTLNHFTKDLKIPQDISEAVRVLQSGSAHKVDIAEVNEHFFVNNSSVGIYTDIVRLREHAEQKGKSRLLAFATAIVRVLRRNRYITVKLNTKQGTVTRRTPLLFVGNNMYELAGFAMGERTSLEQGILSVFVPHAQGTLGLIWLAIRSFLGFGEQATDLDVFETDQLTVETSSKQVPIAVDGEIYTVSTPLRYCIHPKALTIQLP